MFVEPLADDEDEDVSESREGVVPLVGPSWIRVLFLKQVHLQNVGAPGSGFQLVYKYRYAGLWMCRIELNRIEAGGVNGLIGTN